MTLSINYKNQILNPIDYIQLPYIDYSNKNSISGITFFNGNEVKSNKAANAIEGWIELYCIDLEKPLHSKNYGFLRDEKGEVLTYRIKGDILILAVDSQENLVKKID